MLKNVGLSFFPGNLPFLQSVFHSWWYSTICLVNLPWALSKKIESDTPRPGECYPCTSVPMLGWDTMDWAKAAGLGHLTSNPLPILLNSPFQWESRPLSAQQTKPVHLCSKREGRKFDHQTSREILRQCSCSSEQEVNCHGRFQWWRTCFRCEPFSKRFINHSPWTETTFHLNCMVFWLCL